MLLAPDRVAVWLSTGGAVEARVRVGSAACGEVRKSERLRYEVVPLGVRYEWSEGSEGEGERLDGLVRGAMVRHGGVCGVSLFLSLFLSFSGY